MQVREIHKKPLITVSKEKSEELLKKKRKEDEKMVKGMFEFVDAQGGFLEFATRFYPGESIKQMRINHGEICELPLGIVKHLNNTYKKVRSYDLSQPVDMNQKGKMPMSVQKISRVRFTSVDLLGMAA